MANNKGKKEIYTESESIKSGSNGIVKTVFKPENDKIIYARKQQSYQSKDEYKFLQLLIQQQQRQQQQLKLLKIFEQYEENQLYYTIQEYCRKGDIRDKICKMKIDDIKKLILDLGEQLEFIHNNKYVFIDLKPENILISDDGIFKLCDFGSIKKIKLDQSESIADSRAGSDSYMPHDKFLTMNFDIFSFGVIIYELFSHDQLFDDKQQVQSYFDGKYEEILIKFQNHLMIDEIEKIFILLMIDTNELNRPDIKQVNLFFKSDDLGKKCILLSQLQKQEKFIKLLKIQYEIIFNSIFYTDNSQLKQNLQQTDYIDLFKIFEICQIELLYSRAIIKLQNILIEMYDEFFQHKSWSQNYQFLQSYHNDMITLIQYEIDTYMEKVNIIYRMNIKKIINYYNNFSGDKGKQLMKKLWFFIEINFKIYLQNNIIKKQ